MIRDSFSTRFFRFLAYCTLVLTFVVILAGAVVRATQSGMGCPDWPKCYGYYIPPDDPAQLEYRTGHLYEKGVMVIRNDTLWRARANFVAGEEFNRAEWEKYPKHDYARFVVYQTWVEYINRLSGALLGLVVLLLFLVSFFVQKNRQKLSGLSFLLVLFTGFQGWLGALVVSSHLAPVRITLHMLFAFLILALAQLIIKGTERRPVSVGPVYVRGLRRLILISMVLTVVQVLLGTQVREQIDIVAKAADYAGRESWIEQLPPVFLIHRSFSILLAAFIFWMISRVFRSGAPRARRFARLAGLILILEILTGVVLNYAGFPAFAQPVHLLLSVFLFASLLEVWMNTGRKAAN